MLMVFADTLVETNLSFLNDEQADAVAWVKAVPDPRRFGVAVLGADGWVTRLIEKPKDMDNNLVVVGFYYFKDSSALVAAIEEQMRRNIQLKNEYFLADAVNILLESKIKMRTQEVETWLDAGTAEDVLATNRYLLEHGHDNSRGSRPAPERGAHPTGVYPPQRAGRALGHRAVRGDRRRLPHRSAASSATASWMTAPTSPMW